MAISTYGELKTAVENWIARDDLTTRVPEFIALAESRIARDLRISAMETSADLTFSSQTAAQPADFLEARRLYLSTSPIRQMQFVSPIAFWAKYNQAASGVPKVFTIEGQNFLLGPAPDGTYTGKLLYYARFAALSADSDTNWLLTNHPDVYLHAARFEAELYQMNYQDAGIIGQLYDSVIAKTQNSDRQGKWSGDAMSITTDGAMP